MKITKVILDNITTHKRTTVNFTEGINVLSGLNGSGKSTVLKMIGYVLFDCLSENQGDFVRTDTSGHGSSTGTVTVYFTGKDDVEYYVRRVIGGGNTMPRVCFADSHVEKTFAARGDVFSWIREQMAIDRMLDMKSLFQNAIGVDQGTFTMPFLETRANRRDIFGPILNVDVYKKAYDKHIEIQHAFDGEINTYAIQASGLLGEISQKGELISEREGIQAEIATMIEKAR
nr:AAA family ATPase [Candidatus Sigynarchaeota archaeon]